MCKTIQLLIVVIFYTTNYTQADTDVLENNKQVIEEKVPVEEIKLESIEVEATKVMADDKKINNEDLGQFGFGPAFFVISYNKEVLKDSKDVRVKGDGTIDSFGSEYSTAIGLEVHYDFSFPRSQYGYYNATGDIDWEPTSGFTVSPFLGIYDLDNGINGLVAGLVFGYWKGDINYKNKKALNIGLGYTIHKDQLVLASNVSEGAPPSTGLQPIDFTSREDVEGVIIMVSASQGF